MTDQQTPGRRFRAAVQSEQPVQIVGVINAICALLAERAGFGAVYLSGAGVANASHGVPDLGMTSLSDVVQDARRITSATDLPLLVDADTGWSDAEGIEATVRALIGAGVAAMHLEDQVSIKRCGHRPGKQLVTDDQMCDRVKAAVDARADDSFVVMARTDAYSVEGLDRAIERAGRYIQAGADMIFAEAMTTIGEYQRFTQAVSVPVLANVTEFGQTPLFTTKQLHEAGVGLALYPLSAFRAMNRAAQRVYLAIRSEGTQQGVLDSMQTRDELYELLDYHRYEREVDKGRD
jgi:methylisocitrate lyase